MKNCLWYRRVGLLLLIFSDGYAMPPPQEGFYVGILGAASYFPNIDYQTPWPSTFTRPFTNLTTSNVTTRLDYNAGGGGGAQLGYRFRRFRLEGQFLYNINVMNKITYNGTTIGHSQNLADLTSGPYLHGQTSEYMGFINCYYDIRFDAQPLVPYLGIGVGYEALHHTSNFLALDWLTGTQNPRMLPGTTNKETDSDLMGQAIIGFNYDLDSFSACFIDLRYLTFKSASASNTTSTSLSHTPLYTVNFGLNFVFKNHENS